MVYVYSIPSTTFESTYAYSIPELTPRLYLGAKGSKPDIEASRHVFRLRQVPEIVRVIKIQEVAGEIGV